MKNILILIVGVNLHSALLGKGEDKALKQARALISKKEFQKAADVLSKISAEGSKNPEVILLSATVFDSLGDFTKAIALYELMIKEAQNADSVIAHINFLKNRQAETDAAERVRLEKMKNCLACKGTGYIEKTEVCDKCNGYGIVKKECSRCHGDGRVICSGCAGTGSKYNELTKMEIACERCQGQGNLDCSNRCERGFIQADCNKCNGTRTITKKVRCSLH